MNFADNLPIFSFSVGKMIKVCAIIINELSLTLRNLLLIRGFCLYGCPGCLANPFWLGSWAFKASLFFEFYEIDDESGHKRAISPTLWHLLQITCPSVVRKLRPGDFCVLMLLVRTLAFWLGRNGAP